MRRLSLFVHLPVFEELVSVIDTTAEQEMFSVYPLQLDVDLFPLLMEAKPCVLLMSVTHASLNENYQLLKDFKDYRVAHGGQARDPALRIVVISERDAPRGNWTVLGTYELMTGPVLSNVFSFKMARHYHKALSVSEFAPELPVLSEEVLQPVVPTPADGLDWKSFQVQTSPAGREMPPEASTHSEPLHSENRIFNITLQIPELKPDEGSWVQKDVPEQFEEQWEWDPHPQSPAPSAPHTYSWQFTGEKPKYLASQKTWEFQSDHPRLYKTKNSDRGVSKLDPLLELTTDPHHREQIRAKAELMVESIKKKTYGVPLVQLLKMPKERVESREPSGSASAPKAGVTAKPSFEEAIKKRSEHLADLKQQASSEAKHLSELKETEAPGKSKSSTSSASPMAKLKGEIDFSLSAGSVQQASKALHVSAQAPPRISKEAEENDHIQVAALIGEDSSGEKTHLAGKPDREASNPALPPPANSLASSAKLHEPSDSPALKESSGELLAEARQKDLKSQAKVSAAQRKEPWMEAEEPAAPEPNGKRPVRTGVPESAQKTAAKKDNSDPASEARAHLSGSGVEQKTGLLTSSPSDRSPVPQSKSANSPSLQKADAKVISADQDPSSWSALFDDNEKGSVLKKLSQANSSAKSEKGWRLKYIRNSKNKKLNLAPNRNQMHTQIAGTGEANLLRRVIAYIREQLGLKSDQ